MIIERIKVQNFKSIYEPLEINFQDLKGFWKIEGGVGSGKTTLGEAILFGLFGSLQGKNNTDLVSWGQKKGSIEIWCVSKGKKIYINRELKVQGQCPLYVEVDGEPIVFTNKRDVQQQLEKEYFDTSRLMVELLCIISLKNFKSLSALSKSDTKEFLDQVFGFYILTQYTDACSKYIKENNITFQELDKSISNIQSQIQEIRELNSMSHIDKDIQEVIEENRKVLDEEKEWKKQHDDILKEFNKKKQELQTELTKIKTLGSTKAKEIDFIKKGVCPTCGAPIDQSQLLTKEKERETLLKAYKITNDKLQEVIKEQSEYIESQNTTRDEFIKKKRELSILQTQLREQERRKGISQQEIDTLEKELSERRDEKNCIEKEINEWNTLKNILSNDIRYEILAAFIPRLNDNIQEYSSQLSLPYIIEFDETFNCYVKIGNNTEIPISSLSTGQLKTVDICIVMGIVKTIVNSVAFNITFLDELISNMDSELRQTVCKVLRESILEDQSMFIISHTELDDDWFDGSIKVNTTSIDNTYRSSHYEVKNK